MSNGRALPLLRYPRKLQRAAEVDERISRELLGVLREASAQMKAIPAPS